MLVQFTSSVQEVKDLTGYPEIEKIPSAFALIFRDLDQANNLSFIIIVSNFGLKYAKKTEMHSYYGFKVFSENLQNDFMLTSTVYKY